MRVTCGSPAWATKLRLDQRAVLARLNSARPGAVRALDIRVGPPPPARDPHPTMSSPPCRSLTGPLHRRHHSSPTVPATSSFAGRCAPPRSRLPERVRPGCRRPRPVVPRTPWLAAGTRRDPARCRR
ncbi:hypothetical protein [Kitasatospora sp. NPDC093679]|uniref:hypothetical protein n=1 Tax=Kitasatospora sp. NPDC093679 TaxID=3154983 RepID=UPI003433EB44